MPTKTQFVVALETPETDRRIDKIVRKLTGMSVRQAQGLFSAEQVRLNGNVCLEPWKWLVPGDTVEAEFEPGRYYKAAPKAKKYSGFELVFEDRDLLVVNKQASLLTVPTERGETDTLLHRISDYLGRGKNYRPKVWVVHRLDRGVSGLLVVGKHPEIATALREQLAERKPVRRYMAVVAGVMKADEGTFDSLLATDESLTRHSVEDETEGEQAITHYRVVTRFADATLVEIWLETGRRNQIRVHFAEAGHPVIGDQRYRPREARHKQWELPRLALAAVELGFQHPTSGEEQRFKLPLPPEMRSFLAKLESGK